MTLPTPPTELWEGYGSTVEEYLGTGRSDFEAMQKVLAAAGFAVPAGGRVLDLGCAAGRMLRFWPTTLAEIHGADIQAPHVAWGQRSFPPPFRFTLTTTEPALPFDDGRFDLVCAASVLTHTAARTEAWMAELRRVLRPGGMAYVTIHDENTVARLRETPDHWVTRLVVAERGGLSDAFETFVVGGHTPRGAVVFHSLGFVRTTWGPILRIVSITPGAYYYQTAVLLQKDGGS
jgi:SAM-dependent methyltransferase